MCTPKVVSVSGRFRLSSFHWPVMVGRNINASTLCLTEKRGKIHKMSKIAVSCTASAVYGRANYVDHGECAHDMNEGWGVRSSVVASLFCGSKP